MKRICECSFFKEAETLHLFSQKREVEMFFGLKGQFHKIFDTSFFNKENSTWAP